MCYASVMMKMTMKIFGTMPSKSIAMMLLTLALGLGSFDVFVGAASAGEPLDVYNVPPFTENGSSETVTKKEVPRTTVVQMDPFSVAVPKGWTFMAAGQSEKMTGSLTATPSEYLDTDETFFGVNERKEPPFLTIEERAQKINKEKKDWQTHFEDINNVKWLVTEFHENSKVSSKQIKRWAAFAVVKGKEYWILAGTPDDKLKEMESVLYETMRSVAIRGVSVEGSTAAVAAKKTPPAMDTRLLDHWKIVAFKLDDVPALWTEEEAKAMIGKTVVFDSNHIQIGGSSCQSAAKPVVDKEEEHTLLQDADNPCGDTTAPGGPIFTLSRKSCSKQLSFPPYLTFGSQDGIVAFGDSVSFCLKRYKPTVEEE